MDDARPPAQPPAASDDVPTDAATQVVRLRAERDVLRARLDQVAEVIGCKDPSRVVHDVRNVMNELGLLRKLAEFDD